MSLHVCVAHAGGGRFPGRRAAERLLVALVVSCAVAGCGGQSSKSQTDRTQRLANPVVTGPGRLVGIGGGRSLYLHCVGSGSPTVLLEAGFGGAADSWVTVQPELGRTTRTCAYDRAGLGNSLPIPGVHDAGDEITDLQRLLEHANIAPPYVLVGHSYGGLLMRLFAHAHPRDTAGVVLVDAMGRDQDRRFLPVWRAQPRRVRRQLPRPGSQPVEAGVDVMAGEALDAKIRTLGGVPLAVITHGVPEAVGPGPKPPARTIRQGERMWSTLQDELAAMSSDHVHVVALRSGHFIHGPVDGQPWVVIRAVRAVVDAARTGDRLPPCPRVFGDSGVRCRE
jgi:pimeloyl-ACP methyl ester carboxylesterase